jgi:hypothetical protein
MNTLRISDLEEGRYLAFDLRDLLEVLGERSVAARWVCCVEECIPFEDNSSIQLEEQYNNPEGMPGARLVTLAKETVQVIDGVFEAFEGASFLVKLVAVDSSYWEVTAEDDVLDRFRLRFRKTELVL